MIFDISPETRRTMITPMLNKQDLASAFEALSQQRKFLLEVVLVSPKSMKSEGRGFFNDVDFLCEAAQPYLGRYNFALSAFAYAMDKIPSRNSYNQFDRTLADQDVQDRGAPHSFTLGFHFKTDLFREMDQAPDLRQAVVQTAYQISAIFERMGLKGFSLEYNPLGITVRFLPLIFSHRDLSKPQVMKLVQAFKDRVEKEMYPAEHKKFMLGSSLLGQGVDPVPGMPGVFGDAKDLVTVWSLSSPRIAEEGLFADLLDAALNGKKTTTTDVYSPANLQGLSQGWDQDDGPDLVLPAGNTPRSSNAMPKGERRGSDGSSSAFADRKQKEEADILSEYLKSMGATSWTWPLYSRGFSKLYRGLQGGQVLFLQADPFAGALAFDFLMQCAELLAKEGKGQILVLSKKKSAGELALAALGRHHRVPALQPQNGVSPDPMDIIQAHASMFANPPVVPVCAPNEGLENLLNYLDHDFQLRQKRKGGDPLPLTILLDNLEEFRGDARETYRGLLRLRQKLRDLNATLWVTQLLPPSQCEADRALLGLADYHGILDCDGSFDASLRQAASPGQAWEKTFALDPSLQKAMPDLALVRIGFSAQGSHRRYLSEYLYHRPTSLYNEITLPG